MNKTEPRVYNLSLYLHVWPQTKVVHVIYIYKSWPSCAYFLLLCSVLTQFDSNWGFTPYVDTAVPASGAVDWNPLPNAA